VPLWLAKAANVPIEGCFVSPILDAGGLLTPTGCFEEGAQRDDNDHEGVDGFRISTVLTCGGSEVSLGCSSDRLARRDRHRRAAAAVEQPRGAFMPATMHANSDEDAIDDDDGCAGDVSSGGEGEEEELFLLRRRGLDNYDDDGGGSGRWSGGVGNSGGISWGEAEEDDCLSPMVQRTSAKLHMDQDYKTPNTTPDGEPDFRKLFPCFPKDSLSPFL
jgi:hypothetical protein